MTINLIVLAITLLMIGFGVVWCLCPQLRPWMEAPKYRILTWQQSDSGAVRPGAAQGPSTAFGEQAPSFAPRQ